MKPSDGMRDKSGNIPRRARGAPRGCKALLWSHGRRQSQSSHSVIKVSTCVKDVQAFLTWGSLLQPTAFSPVSLDAY